MVRSGIRRGVLGEWLDVRLKIRSGVGREVRSGIRRGVLGE